VGQELTFGWFLQCLYTWIGFEQKQQKLVVSSSPPSGLDDSYGSSLLGIAHPMLQMVFAQPLVRPEAKEKIYQQGLVQEVARFY
jgi:hypothetical protein